MNRKVGLISYFMYCSTYIPSWYLVLESNFVLLNILCPFYLVTVIKFGFFSQPKNLSNRFVLKLKDLKPGCQSIFSKSFWDVEVPIFFPQKNLWISMMKLFGGNSWLFWGPRPCPYDAKTSKTFQNPISDAFAHWIHPNKGGSMILCFQWEFKSPRVKSHVKT